MSSSLSHDLALKSVVSLAANEKPQFRWAEALNPQNMPRTDVRIFSVQGEEEYRAEKVAQSIGAAIADLEISQGNEDIFNVENRAFVAKITAEVTANLRMIASDSQPPRVRSDKLHILIEKTLADNAAYDVAKSLILKRALRARPPADPGTVRIIRRNNQVVPWTETKVEIAVRKALLSLQRDSSPATYVARAVTARIEGAGQAFFHIEEVQDIVQEELMKAGHFKVAEHYILYRAQRAAQRLTEAVKTEPVFEQESMIVIKKANGETVFWDGSDLKARIRFAMIDLSLNLSEEEIEAELRRSIFDEISEEDLKRTIVLNSRTLIERDADFAKLAGRILLTYIYEEVLNWDILRDGIGGIKEAHQRYFHQYLRRGIEINRLNPQLLEYDIEKLTAALDPSADLGFDYLGIQTLYDRYLIIDKTGKTERRLETPQIFWLRVAMGLFLQEEKGTREDSAIELYELYRLRRFCSSTPTLFNSGTLHSQLSSCYLYYVDDSIEGIMIRGIAENAFLSKWAGGLGGSWTAVRGTGGHIAGTNGESQGVIPFLKLHNDQLVAVNQGGKRRGSGCAYLETWHNDLYEFLELRRNTGDDRRRCHDMNTANWIPDLFMKRMEAREDWTFFRANEVPDLHEIYGKAFDQKYVEYEKMAGEGKIFGKTVPAIDVWKKMLQMLFETGHPWITFKDPCNIRSPQDHVGVIHSSNLCTEITLNTSNEETAVCNLGSIVLENHLDGDGEIDHKKLRETIRVAVRALDNVIDINFYPTEAARTANSRHRPIGLGIMGLQNCLYLRGDSFASQEAVEFNDEIMEAVAYYAYEASSDLAAELGTYSSYKGSKWDRGLLPQDTIDLLAAERGVEIDVVRGGKMDWTPVRAKIAKQGMRNSNVLAIAPTATISNITGTTPCIEPAYKNLFVKSNLSGEFIILNASMVRDLKARDLWNPEMLDNLKYFDGDLTHIEEVPQELKDRYMTAFDIDHTWLVEAAARRQKWIDQSQSVNLFLGTPDMKALSHMYRAAWRKGLKTTYYLRSLGASNIEKATVAVRKEGRPNGRNGDSAGYTDEEKNACSIEAMQNGEDCEACQ